MYNLQDLEREYGNVYKSVPPPNMPGIRDISVKPWETVEVQDLNKLFVNYPTSTEIHSIQGQPMPPFIPPQRFVNYTGLDCPYKGPRDAVEGFNMGMGGCTDVLFKLALFLFVLALAYYILAGENMGVQQQAVMVGGWPSY